MVLGGIITFKKTVWDLKWAAVLGGAVLGGAVLGGRVGREDCIRQNIGLFQSFLIMDRRFV